MNRLYTELLLRHQMANSVLTSRRRTRRRSALTSHREANSHAGHNLPGAVCHRLGNHQRRTA